MTRSTRRGGALGALLGATAGALSAAPAPAASTIDAGRAEPTLVETCWAEALPVAQIAAGVVSEVECTWTVAGRRVPQSRSGAILAYHYDGSSGGGSSFYVTGSGCEGWGLNVSSEWNNRISSTEFISCGNVKHFTGASYTGDSQLVSGGYGAIANLNATLNNQTSSIQYG